MEMNVDQMLQQGCGAHNAGNLQEAERVYRAILQIEPKHPDANHNLGLIAVAVNQSDAALPLFKNALEANPAIEQFWLSYIEALITQGEFDDAREALSEGEQKGVDIENLKRLTQQLEAVQAGGIPRHAPSRRQLNTLLDFYETGRHGDAEKLAVSITQEFPTHQFGWKVLGALLKQTGRVSEALLASQKSVQLMPQDADAHNNLGVTLIELGRSDEAEVSLRQAIALKPDYAEAHSNLGNVLQELGRLADAEASFTQAIALKPDYVQAHYNFGNTLKELGRLDEAEASLRRAIGLKPDYAKAHSNLGQLLQELGRLDEAEESCTQAINIQPDYAEAHNNLGITLQKVGRFAEAEVSLRQAIVLKPDSAEAHNNLGNMLKGLCRLNESEDNHRQAIALKPDFAEAHYNLGNTLRGLLKLVEAEGSYKKSIALKPDLAEAYGNLGVTLQELGRLEEAKTSYIRAIALKPAYPEAHNNLGNALKELGSLDEAETRYTQAIALKRDFAEAHNNLGSTLREQGRFKEAEKSYRQAINFKQDYAEAHSNLGIILAGRASRIESLDCYLKAMSLSPSSVSYRWDFSIGQLSKVYLDFGDLKKCLSNFEKELTNLQEFITAKNLDETAKVVGKSQPYYLAFFEKNNKPLLEKHGDICCRVMGYWQEKNEILPVNPTRKSDAGERIKIGIVSAHIRYHSVWNAFLKGMIKNLNAEKFEIHIFSLSNRVDDETNIAKAAVKYFNAGEIGLTQWAKKIKNSGIDIAFYPEIGMDGQTIQLASMRLAPIQVCSYGHPETSGLPTMDYYISSELLETSKSDSFYTEKLIKLPGLGYYFEPPPLESSDIDFMQMGIDQNSPTLLCLGAPNKFSPLYDWVLIEIIRRLENCQLVFMHDVPGASEVLARRLKVRIEDAGFVFDKYVVFVPQQSRQGFSALMKNADLLLDSPGFSGLNTAMQAIGCGLPVVTREGEFQRSRHASAILRTLGVEELITKTETEYIDLVERIVLDREFLHDIKCKIKDKENVLYRNEDAIRSLEDFFEGVISDSLESAYL
jgi:tetratricopeptide (TPR) repeat protein